MSKATRVVVGTSKWNLKAEKLINRGKRLSLVVRGPEAGACWEVIRKLPAPRWSPKGNPKPREAVALSIAIVLAIVALAGMAVVGAVCIYGMHQGYRINARHRVRGPMIGDHELVFDLIPS